MAEYIERATVLQILAANLSIFEDSDESARVSMVDISALPALDVAPVRRGRWILDDDPHDGDCRCSVCLVAINQMHERNHGLLNALTGGKWWKFYNYCPSCGAKMDGGADA